MITIATGLCMNKNIHSVRLVVAVLMNALFNVLNIVSDRACANI